LIKNILFLTKLIKNIINVTLDRGYLKTG